MKTNKTKGFTLVELIIVIAVIGVLAAILIPVFANVIEKANAKSALSDAKNALEIYIAETTDGTGSLTIGEGSVFKIKKGNKDWYYTYFEGALHDGSGAPNSNPLNSIPQPAGSIKCMAPDSVYASERDADTQVYDNMPKTVIIYNTGANATYTPPTEDVDRDGDYILISRANQLTTRFFTEHGLNSSYKLANNIAISGSFEPISCVLTGEFDGNNKTVSGISINKPNDEGIGLFVQFNGNIHDLNLEVSQIYAKAKVGALCGTTEGGSLTNIHINIVNAISNYVEENAFHPERAYNAGICAVAKNASISRCSVRGLLESSMYGGGIVASAENTTISESYFIGIIHVFNSFGDYVGGIAAEARGCTIEDCYSNAEYQGSSGRMAGICSYPTQGTLMKHCVSIATQAWVESEPLPDRNTLLVTAGPICSSHTGETDHTVTECYYLATNCLYYFEPVTVWSEGELIESWADAVGLSSTIWDISGERPVLVNNPE